MTYHTEKIETAIAKIAECMARDPKRAERLLGDVTKWSAEAEREAYARGKADAAPQASAEESAIDKPIPDSVEHYGLIDERVGAPAAEDSAKGAGDVDERVAFEASERNRPGYGEDTLTVYTQDAGEYALPLTQARWVGWQARAALAAKPAASAEPVAWVAADTLNSPHPKCVSSLAYMSQIDQDRGREYVPLYIAPVAAHKPDGGEAKDAERWRHAKANWLISHVRLNASASMRNPDGIPWTTLEQQADAAISARQRQGAATANDGEAGR